LPALISPLGVDQKSGSLLAPAHNLRTRGTGPHNKEDIPGDMVPPATVLPDMDKGLRHMQAIKYLTADSKITRVLMLSIINNNMHNNKGLNKKQNVLFFVSKNVMHVTDFFSWGKRGCAAGIHVGLICRNCFR
jgi:hypothetical protein